MKTLLHPELITWFERAPILRPQLRFSALPSAFTLMELLVTISVIAILAALLLPAIHTAKARALRTACLSNMNQFSLAFQLYASEHADSILPNKGGERVPLGETWVEGWIFSGPDCTNTLYLQRSLVGSYVKDTRIWRCPANRDTVLLGGQSFNRVRTFSMNHFMGAPWSIPELTTYRRLSDVKQPAPSDQLVFIEERNRTINDGAFAVRIDFNDQRPDTWWINDLPSVDHNRGCNLVFADGHVQFRRWHPSTAAMREDAAAAPHNPDALWLQQHSTYRSR